MLAEMFKQSARQKEREAWVQWRKLLEAWETRREGARARGEAFDEPKPEPPA